MTDRHLVVIHSPGPSWEPGLPLMQQTGIQEHRTHYAQLLEQGVLMMSEPFLDSADNGIMICKAGTDEDMLRMHALTDPAVETGLLQFEIRPWLPALKA